MTSQGYIAKYSVFTVKRIWAMDNEWSTLYSLGMGGEEDLEEGGIVR